jgi:hypothetical protein
MESTNVKDPPYYSLVNNLYMLVHSSLSGGLEGGNQNRYTNVTAQFYNSIEDPQQQQWSFTTNARDPR